MKTVKILLVIFFLLQLLPIFFTILLSFRHVDGNVFKWYYEIINNRIFTGALLLSFLVSVVTACLSTLFSFVIGLSWFGKKQTYFAVIGIIILGLVPSDILSLSISSIAQVLGFDEANLFFLVVCLVFYCIPYGTLIIWSRFYYVNNSIIMSAKDLGMKRVPLVMKILAPLSGDGILNCFLLSFLLTFNEYTRVYYLSGSNLFLSEYLNGKLSSGTDESIYAGASIMILITIIVILIFGSYRGQFR